MARTALLIRCVTDADRIRPEAGKEHRTISACVLGIAAHTSENENRLYAKDVNVF